METCCVSYRIKTIIIHTTTHSQTYERFLCLPGRYRIDEGGQHIDFVGFLQSHVSVPVGLDLALHETTFGNVILFLDVRFVVLLNRRRWT